MSDYKQNIFNKIFIESIPLSFKYNGTDAGSLFSKPALVTSECISEYDTYRSSMLCGDGCLECVLNIRKYESAIEWWLEMGNVGSVDTYIVSDLDYADILVPSNRPIKGGNWEYPLLCYARGSQAEKEDFRMTKEQFYPNPAKVRVFECSSGRASSEHMPYFNIQTSADAGVILAIGWSGTWKARIKVKDGDSQRTVTAKVGFRDAYFRLQPGEHIQLPSMLAMPWEFENEAYAFDKSHNAFRSFIYNHMLHKINGKPNEGMICLRAWGGFSKERQSKKIDNIKKHRLPGDIYAIDAGWYGKPNSVSSNSYFDKWFSNAGDWEPLPSLFPNGLKGLSDEAAEAGLGFSAWFELERANVEADIIKEHREYFLGHTFKKGAYAPSAGFNMWFGMLLNLGYEPARLWIRDKIAKTVRDSNMTVFRIDYNLEPADYWRYSDGPDRRGITEIKYINGLYKTFDELLEMFPDLTIDNCAGGGRRLDYALCKRAIPMMCRSDYFTGPDYKPEGVQAHTYALSSWLPVHGDSAGSCSGASPLCMDTYKFRSSICSGIGIAVPDWDMTEEEGAWYRKMLNEAYRVKPFTCKDFYPLTGYTLMLKDWMAVRFHDPDTGNGVIMAFRREESFAVKYVFELTEGIDRDALYELEDADEDNISVVNGDSLISGVPVEINDKRASKLIFYTKKV